MVLANATIEKAAPELENVYRMSIKSDPCAQPA
jgi:hypothetical protein